jgi:hypothetical protein
VVKNQVKILVHVSAGVSVAPTGQVSGKFAIGNLCENLARNMNYGIIQAFEILRTFYRCLWQ